MHQMARRRRTGGSGVQRLLFISIVLLALGVVFGGGLGALFWPLFLIAPALALFYLVRHNKSARILTIPATMLATVGMILLLSNVTGLWGIWSYAWALVFPGAFGMGLSVYGELTRKRKADRWGETLAKVGLGIFLVGFVLNVLLGVGSVMTGLLGLGLMPLLLIGGLLFFLLRRKRKPKRRAPLGGGRYDTLGDGSDSLDLDSTLWQEERERV